MILYAFPISMFSQKVMMVCYEKGIDVTVEAVNPLDGNAANPVLRASPWARVPILVAGDGRVVYESAIIAEYLDGLPGRGPKLFPEDRAACLDVRYYDRVIDLYLIFPFRRLFYATLRPADARSSAMVKDAHEQLDEAYAWLEGQVSKSPWVAGSAFSIADCSAAVALARGAEVYGFESYPAISAYFARLRQRESFRRVQDAARAFTAASAATVARAVA
jgi:glutathione S-transferase